MDAFLQSLASGLVVGALYSLVGVGIVVIYKSTHVFNFAQGGLLMLGAYLTWYFMVQVDMPVWLGLICGLCSAIVIGFLIERLGMRRLVGQPILSLIIVTLALEALISGIITLLWGDREYNVFPEFIPPDPVEFFNIILSLQHIIIFVVTMVIIALFILFFKYSRWGLDMRAVAEDHQASMCTGISTKLVFIMAWAISTLLATIGGVLLGSINGVSTTLNHIANVCFPVVLLGGLESIPGVLIAGLIVGILEYMSGQYIDPIVGASTREVVPYIILILALIIKPYGLFGLERIERI
ncbi:MAG TPA: branched-chain amino acid ABC transporter permease [Desulfobacteraceae bacterium]|nr:branched-chain amino acid ABC transporter permease [Desulfobacteraceae bacterium]